MTPRIDIMHAAPEAIKAMMRVEMAIEQSGLEHSLIELVKIRASQLNGCAFCIHMHVSDAVKRGESEMRIHLLDAWREAPVFTERERAALNWTESVTRIGKTRAPDSDYELVAAQFDEREVAYLTALIGAINFWNRIQIALRAVPDVEPVAVAA